MNDVRNTIYDLENDLGVIGCKVETLEDIQIELNLLRQDMEEMEHKDDFTVFQLREIFRKVRLLDELLNYTMDELKPRYDQAYNTNQNLFNVIVKGQSDVSTK